jgi:arylesterase/paraoxonase
MNRVRRSLIILAVSVVVTFVAMIVRWLNAGGAFTEVKPGFDGTCTVVASAPGPGVIAIDAEDRLAFVATADRRAFAQGKTSPADGLYSFALANPEAGLKRVPGAPPGFHPRSISLYRAPGGGLTLMAINVPVGSEASIAIFDVAVKDGAPTLKERTAITSGFLVRPQGIAAVGPDRFYVSNSGTSATAFGRFLETYALMPRANILYFDGNLFRVAADDLSDAHGILVSADGAHVYVASKSGRVLYAFARGQLSGRLTEEGSLSIDSGLSGIASDAKGGLLVAGTPRPFDEDRYRDNPSGRRAPSQVFEVALKNGIPQASEPLYTNKGEQLSDAGSAAGMANGHVFISSPLDKKILDCALDTATD